MVGGYVITSPLARPHQSIPPPRMYTPSLFQPSQRARKLLNVSRPFSRSSSPPTDVPQANRSPKAALDGVPATIANIPVATVFAVDAFVRRLCLRRSLLRGSSTSSTSSTGSSSRNRSSSSVTSDSPTGGDGVGWSEMTEPEK